MIKNFYVLITGILLASAAPGASDLESALAPFARYNYGQPKKVLHDARLAAFKGTANADTRKKHEQLLLAFVQSDAGINARRMACLWLGDLGSATARPVLEQLSQKEIFADVALIALDALSSEGAIASDIPSNASALFKASVVSSGKPTAVLQDAIQGNDELRARQAFALVAEGVEQKEMFRWLEANVQILKDTRQIITMNLLMDTDAPEKVSVITGLSREGKGPARLAALRKLGALGYSGEVDYLAEAWLSPDKDASAAAHHALHLLPEPVVRDKVLPLLTGSDTAAQGKVITLVEQRGSAFASAELRTLAKQDDNLNRKAAIRALGKTEPPDAFGRLLDQYIRSEGSSIHSTWKLAAWDMARRQPDYRKASTLLKQKKAGAPESVAKSLESIMSKLKGLETAEHVIHAPKAKPEKAIAQPKHNLLLPSSFREIIPKRFDVAAYMNCGPDHTVKQNGVSIACANGKGWNSEAETPPSLSVLFSAPSLDFTINGLEDARDYVLGMTWWDSDLKGRRQSIWINGKEVLPDTRAIAYDQPNREKQHKFQGRPTPVRIQFALLPEHISNGRCEVTVRKTGPSNVVTSEIWVAKRRAPKAEKQILLLTGQDFPGHHWRKTAPVIEEIVAGDERMEVTLCETPGGVGLKHLDFYDAVFIHFKNYEEDMPATEAMKEGLARFVTEGGGLCMSHFACGAFMEWPNFVNLSGRIWSGGGHEKRGPFRVNVIDETHPVTQGIEKSFKTYDELYWCLTGEPEVHVLCEAFSKRKQANQPQAFVYEPSKGRVFLSTLGHDVRAYDAAEVKRLYRQGAAWAAGLE